MALRRSEGEFSETGRPPIASTKYIKDERVCKGYCNNPKFMTLQEALACDVRFNRARKIRNEAGWPFAVYNTVVIVCCKRSKKWLVSCAFARGKQPQHEQRQVSGFMQ